METLRNKIIDKRNLACGMPAAFILSISIVIGAEIDQFGVFRYDRIFNYFILLLLSAIFYLIITLLFLFMDHYHRHRKVQKISFCTKWFRLICQSGMLLCWLPILLAAWPGFFCYDAAQQFQQVIQNSFTTHHPLLHTLLLGNTLVISENMFGSINMGVLAYCVIQMIVLTAIFTEVIIQALKRLKSIWPAVLCFIFYSFFPTIVMFGLCTTKDTIFSGLFLLFILYMVNWIEEEGKDIRLLFKTILSGVFMLLFRNNGIYALFLFFVVVMLFYKNKRKLFIKIILPTTLLFLLISTILSVTLHAKKTDLREMLSVPAQQIARVYNLNGKDFFSEDDLHILYSLIPESDLTLYNEKLADPVKANLHVGFNSTLPKFCKLWLEYAIKAPTEYVNAALIQIYQAFYPGAVLDGYCGERAKARYVNSASCYFSCDVEEPAYLDSKIPTIYQLYYNISREAVLEKIPIVSFFYSIGGMFFITIISFSYLVYIRKWAALSGIGFILCLYLTCLLGPIVLVRYYLVLFYCIPFVLITVFEGQQSKIDH